MNTWSQIVTKGRRTPSFPVTTVQHTATTGVAASHTVIARADVAYARNLLQPKFMKGSMGEFFAQRFFLNNQLEQNIRGNWIPLNPRSGPQGLDHLFMKIGKNGHLYWMVGESKYGSSQLGTTVDGARQLSTQWTSKRIHNLGNQYIELSTMDVQLKALPHVPPKAQFDVSIGGKTVSFWKDSNNQWYFNGTIDELQPAQDMAGKMGNSLISPNCNIRVRLFHIEAVGNDLKVTLYHVKTDEVTSIANMTPSKEFTVPELLGKNITDKELKKEIAKALRKHFPQMSDEELRQEADNIAQKYKNGDLLKTPRPLWQTVTLQSLVAAGAAGIIDAGIQLLTTRKLLLDKTLLAAGSAGLGTASGQIISIMLLKTTVGQQTIRSISGFINLGTSMTRSVLSSMGGGIVTSLLLSYGTWALGYCDSKQANRQAMAGIGGTIAGGAVALGVPALVAQFGTCSTGTAIASLHGAAATKATMAWLGFGTVANGGLGVAGGAMLLGGYVMIAAVTVSSLISLGFSIHDANERRQYSMLLATKYKNKNIWDIIAEKQLGVHCRVQA